MPALAGRAASAAHAPLRADVRPFATLPADFRFPQSLAADPESGDVHVGSFDAREPSSVRDGMQFDLPGQAAAQHPGTVLKVMLIHNWLFGQADLCRKLAVSLRPGRGPIRRR